MFECLKDGYNFFEKYDKGNLIATLTLKEGDIYKDVVKLEDDELVFLYTFYYFHLAVASQKLLIL